MSCQELYHLARILANLLLLRADRICYERYIGGVIDCSDIYAARNHKAAESI